MLPSKACLIVFVLLVVVGCSASESETSTTQHPKRAHIQPSPQGVTSDDIAHVYAGHESHGTTGVGGMYYVSYKDVIWVLYKNGWGCTNGDRNLMGVTLESITRESDCFRWKQDGRTIRIKLAGQNWETLENLRKVIPALNDTRLNRNAKGIYFDGNVSKTWYFSFSWRGDYEMARSSQVLVSSPNPALEARVNSLSGYFGGKTHYEDKSGERDSTYSIIGNGGTGYSNTTGHQGGRPDLAGAYYIDGYTIELIKNDGTRERKVFGYLENAPDQVVLGAHLLNLLLPEYLQAFEQIASEVIMREDETYILIPENETRQTASIQLQPLGAFPQLGPRFRALADKLVEADAKHTGLEERHVNLLKQLHNMRIYSATSGEKILVYLAMLSQNGTGYFIKAECRDVAAFKKYMPDVIRAGLTIT